MTMPLATNSPPPTSLCQFGLGEKSLPDPQRGDHMSLMGRAKLCSQKPLGFLSTGRSIAAPQEGRPALAVANTMKPQR